MSTVFEPTETRTADVVVVGGGVAGLSAALHARGREVVVVSKSPFAEGGSSVHAQGGVAAALAFDDNPALHARDTLDAGAGLCDESIVDMVTRDGPRRIKELVHMGAEFDRGVDGQLTLGREGAHSRRRIAHAAGDATGAELMRTLAAAVRRSSSIRSDDRVLALDLVLDRGSVVGLAAIDWSGRHILYVASEVILATGGVGRLWSRTTNPEEVTGDGLAMALRVGAHAADLEFVQFHPTALAVAGSQSPLLTEALRGEGAHLIDDTGRRFMLEEHPAAELAPRDVVARAIWRRQLRGHTVLLDVTAIGGGITNRFPTVAGLCRDHGFALANEAVPVSPAAHYHMGGIMVDKLGHTSVRGLWAVGETARTGLHGANRLASNSLLEALVFGAAAGKDLAAKAAPPPHPVRAREAAARSRIEVSDQPWLERGSEHDRNDAARLGDIMWTGVGLERDAAGLHRASVDLKTLASAIPSGLGELGNMVEVAHMVLGAASLRTESRGAHWRSDFPRTSACWRQELIGVGSSFIDPHPIAPAAVSG